MKFRLFCSLGILVVSSVALRSQTWIGGGGNQNWSTPGNWTGGVPANNGTATIDFTNASPFASVIDSNYSVFSVLIGSNAGSLSLNGITGLTTLTIASGSSLDDTSPNAVSIGMLLVGLGEVDIEGGGTVTQTSSGSTFSGGYLVNNGILSDNAVNAFSPNSLLEVGPQGIVLVNNNEVVAGLQDYLGGGGLVKIAIGTTLTFTGGFSTTYSGTLVDNGGPGSLAVNNSAGTLTLTGTNTYTGTTTIAVNAGLSLGNGGTTGSIMSNVTGTGSLVFNRSNAYTFTNAIGGSIDIVQQGTGITTLSGFDTYTGPTTINNGTLQAGSASAFGGATGLSPISFTNTSTLDLNNFSNTVGSINGSGASFINLGSATLTVANPVASSNYTGVISGTGGIVFSGASTLLTGANTYGGGTSVTNGVLVIANATGSATGTGTVSILPGASLAIGAGSNAGSVAATNINDNGSIAFDRSDSPTIASNIVGSGTVTLNGGGTWTLTGTNTYSGLTTVNAGTLTAGSVDSFGTNAPLDILTGGIVNLNGIGQTVGRINGDSSGQIELGGGLLTINSAGIGSFPGVISGGGALTLTGGITETLTGANTFSGGLITIGPGSTLFVGDGATLGARVAASITNNGNLVFAVSSTDNYLYVNTLNGNGPVTFSGPGTFTFPSTGEAQYSGLTSVDQGVLADGAPNAFSSSSRMLVDSSGGNLQVNFNETIADLENGGAGGPVSIAAGAILSSLGVVYAGDFGGPISGAGGFAVLAGKQGLSGANNFGGGTLVAPGAELFVGSDTALGTGALTLAAGSEFSPDANVTLTNQVILTGSGSVDNDDGANWNMALRGNISEVGGPASLTWCAPGTFTLTGTNSFSGGVDMRQGTLVLGDNVAAGSGTITLDSGTTLNLMGGVLITNPINPTGTGATLTGNGTFGSPAITVASGLIISPSASPGGGPATLTFANPLSLASGATINFHLFDANGSAGSGFDLVQANGGLNLAAAATGSIAINVFSVNSTGGVATAINFNGVNPYQWLFVTSSGITGFAPGGTQFAVNGSGFLNAPGGIFSVTQNVNDLVLNFTPVPEPATWAMMGAGALSLVPFAFRRKRLEKA